MYNRILFREEQESAREVPAEFRRYQSFYPFQMPIADFEWLTPREVMPQQGQIDFLAGVTTHMGPFYRGLTGSLPKIKPEETPIKQLPGMDLSQESCLVLSAEILGVKENKPGFQLRLGDIPRSGKYRHRGSGLIELEGWDSAGQPRRETLEIAASLRPEQQPWSQTYWGYPPTGETGMRIWVRKPLEAPFKAQPIPVELRYQRRKMSYDAQLRDDLARTWSIDIWSDETSDEAFLYRELRPASMEVDLTRDSVVTYRTHCTGQYPETYSKESLQKFNTDADLQSVEADVPRDIFAGWQSSFHLEGEPVPVTEMSMKIDDIQTEPSVNLTGELVGDGLRRSEYTDGELRLEYIGKNGFPFRTSFKFRDLTLDESDGDGFSLKAREYEVESLTE